MARLVRRAARRVATVGARARAARPARLARRRAPGTAAAGSRQRRPQRARLPGALSRTPAARRSTPTLAAGSRQLNHARPARTLSLRWGWLQRTVARFVVGGVLLSKAVSGKP